jgi:voltage-gated potassium channel
MGDKSGAARYDLVKNRVHEILDDPKKGDRQAMIVQGVIAGAIIANTMTIILFTVNSIEDQYRLLFNPIMGVCFVIFTIEYFLRIWSCSTARDLHGMIADRARYAFHFYQIIDLISLIPFLFPFLIPRHFTLLRALRILSIFKLGRYSRYSQSLNMLRRVFFSKKEIFAIMLFILVFLVLFSSTLMYLIEKPVQPDKFSSIPAAMWWSMMTITTVGYGDIIPITPIGKIIGSVMTFIGVLVLALPAAILATGFIEERDRGSAGGSDPDQYQKTSRAKEELLNTTSWLYEQGKITSEEYDQITHIACSIQE